MDVAITNPPYAALAHGPQRSAAILIGVGFECRRIGWKPGEHMSAGAELGYDGHGDFACSVGYMSRPPRVRAAGEQRKRLLAQAEARLAHVARERRHLFKPFQF